MLDSEITIPVIKLNCPAHYPYVVQGQEAENWSTISSVVSLPAALEKARTLSSRNPGMRVRIEHHLGDLLVTDQLPAWKPCESGDKPYDLPLWTGAGDPPPIGSKVTVAINDVGPGLVTGYAIQRGWLAVMVQADEDTRPFWHRKENPENRPTIAYGAEILYP